MPTGLKESTKRYLFHVRLILLQRLCQLIRAGSWAEAALDAGEPLEDFFVRHAFHKGGKGFEVPRTAACKADIFKDTVIYFKFYLP